MSNEEIISPKKSASKKTLLRRPTGMLLKPPSHIKDTDLVLYQGNWIEWSKVSTKFTDGLHLLQIKT